MASPPATTMHRDAEASSGCASCYDEFFLTGCCLPCLASVPLVFCLFCAPQCRSCCVSPECYEGLERAQAANSNQLTLYKLQHPSCCWPCFSTCVFIDGGVPSFTGHVEYRTTYLRRQEWFGGAWSISGKLVLAEADVVNEKLLGPMDRGAFLGVHPLVNLPVLDNGQVGFPLAIASGACPMNKGGYHATFHALFARFLWNDAARARMDASNPLVVRAAREFKASFDEAKAKYDSGDGGALNGSTFVQQFCARLVHWGLFGIDLGKPGSEDFETAMFVAGKVPAVMYYLSESVNLGSIVRKIDLNGVNGRLASLQRMYVNAPALAEFANISPAEVPMYFTPSQVADLNGSPPADVTKAEFIRQLIPAVIIAGLQGPAALGHTLLSPHFGGIGAGHLATSAEAAYPLCAPADFAWPYGDKTKLSLCVLETLRINPAVYETTYTLSEPMTVPDYARKGPKTFPKGCPVLLPFNNTGAAESTWGPTARSWDPYGHAAMLDGPDALLNGFNGVGARGQRVCPGRNFAIDALVHMLNAVGGEFAA